MTTHKLKSWPSNFAALRRGNKTFEIRENDRDYKVGDLLILQEFVPDPGGTEIRIGHPHGSYTHNQESRWVTHVTYGNSGVFGLAPGFVVLGLRNDHEQMWHPTRGYDRQFFASEVEVKPGDKIPFKVGGGAAGGGTAERVTSIPVVQPPIPPCVYWSDEQDNFYSVVNLKGMGEAFYADWIGRFAEFPRNSSALNMPLNLTGDRKVDAQIVEELNALSAPLTEYQRELLTILNEECLEVGIQISKLLRFGRIGIDRSVTPNVRYDNIDLLGREIGDVQHMINVIVACELVRPWMVKAGEVRKATQLSKYLQSKRPPDYASAPDFSEVHEGQG